MNGIKGRSGLVMAAIALALAAPAAAQFSDGYNFLKAVRDKDVMKAKGFIDKPGSTIINARDGDSGETALMIAIKRRDTPWMGFLLQNGADPNLRDRDGNTPLGVAAMNAFPDGVRVMLASRAQVDGANNRGETPLIKAVHMRDATSVQYLLNAGADKISINSSAVRNPGLVDELALEFGSQCVVVAIDTRYVDDEHMVHTHGGRKPTELRTLTWAKEVEDRGAGEILLTSMDTDGTKAGFALDLTAQISGAANIPVIASGGAGTMDHFVDVFTTGKADAGLAASIFHFKEIEIPALKWYLREKGIEMRM